MRHQGFKSEGKGGMQRPVRLLVQKIRASGRHQETLVHFLDGVDAEHRHVAVNLVDQQFDRVLDGGLAGALETGPDAAPPPRGPEGRYKRPYEGTDNAAAAMQAYLDWEYGLVAQLERDGTHGFFVI